LEININDDELLRIKWEHTRNILKGEGEEDFVQVRTLFKDYTHIIKRKIRD